MTDDLERARRDALHRLSDLEASYHAANAHLRLLEGEHPDEPAFAVAVAALALLEHDIQDAENAIRDMKPKPS